MRWLLPLALCGVVIASPRVAEGSEIFFGTLGLGELAYDFDLDGFRLLDGTYFSRTYVNNVERESSGSCSGDIEGTVNLVSGPLIDLTLVGEGEDLHSVYRYGPGEISIAAEWPADCLETAHGHFVAPLQSFIVTMAESLFVDDDCPMGVSCGHTVVTLGPGAFDAAFAGVLGLSRPNSDGGTLFIPMDGVFGDLSWRIGGSQSGTFDLSISVPEPSLTALAATFIGLAMIRWRRRRAV